MRILLVHQNFPGQFLHLAPALVARGHHVVAMTADDNPRTLTVPVARYKWKAPDFSKDTYLRQFSEMAYRGEVVASASAELRDRHNFTPDVIFGTPGWGEMLFLGHVWPSAKRLVYAEFFYAADGPNEGFDAEYAVSTWRSRMSLSVNGAHLLMSVCDAHKLLAPTQWQARSFPDFLQSRMTVIHDGIDTARVTPADHTTVVIPGTGITIAKGDEVLTFINRNLEPARGFHIFMRALPQILKARPNARVVIIGGDERSYSRAPAQGGTWRQLMLNEVGARLDLSRVHFVGKVPYPVFVDLMRATRVHAYLTYPFVLSWSLLEAMSAGAYIVGSRTGPVEEVIEHGVNGHLVDFFDVDGIARALIEGLEHPTRFDHLRKAARQTVIDRYDLQSCLPKMVSFVETA